MSDWPARRFPIPGGDDAVRVNLACGADYREGWLNVDADPTGSLKLDKEVNLEDLPWPLDTSSADYVLMRHIIEHIRHGLLLGVTRKSLALARDVHESGKWDARKAAEIERLASKDGLVLVMEELHRILKPGGIIDVLTPGVGTPDTWRDPTHTRGMEPDFWTYFSAQGGYTREYYSTARFELVDQWFTRTLNYRAPFTWLGVKDYHVDKYLPALAPAVKRLGVRNWHLTRLKAVK